MRKRVPTDRLNRELELKRGTLTGGNMGASYFSVYAESNSIWEVCQGALIYQKICFVVGETHSGKTTPLIEYQREHKVQRHTPLRTLPF